jgi:hypothetical protein
MNKGQKIHPSVSKDSQLLNQEHKIVYNLYNDGMLSTLKPQ